MGSIMGSSALPETPKPVFPPGTPCWLLRLASVGVLLALELWAKDAQMTPLGISCGALRPSWNVEHYFAEGSGKINRAGGCHLHI